MSKFENPFRNPLKESLIPNRHNLDILEDTEEFSDNELKNAYSHDLAEEKKYEKKLKEYFGEEDGQKIIELEDQIILFGLRGALAEAKINKIVKESSIGEYPDFFPPLRTLSYRLQKLLAEMDRRGMDAPKLKEAKEE